MKRRDFFRNTALGALGAAFTAPLRAIGQTTASARNIIFMVSDGMSNGTLTMASLLRQRKEGKQSHWLQLYESGKATRALMSTASATSLVTDSAAGSSAWGGGVRVPNGSLNVGADGTHYTPILQKFKKAGRATGCVTTVPITHATPAGFCINNSHRGDMGEIALQYLPLQFDVMLGGGREYFLASHRKDKQDLLQQYQNNGYTVIDNRDALLQLPAANSSPVLGVFCENGLPYALDREQDTTLQQQIPTLAEMTTQAIRRLSKHPKGFMLQVEGGKVDWAAHANDAAALLYDQLAFDDAVKVALDFAATDKNTLVIITTDHGNANPGLYYSDKANSNFDKLHTMRHTNDWILNGIQRSTTPAALIERIEHAQGLVITPAEAGSLLAHYSQLDGDGLYNPRKLPFKELAMIQSAYTSINWGGMDHTADYVELAMTGPGSELLPPFVKNTDLHPFILKHAGI
ncbi:alkaline phosphatase [Chitinophaga qingshengii]|uniref:Alkaline phosphatase n=1 Tax=Chitinophaga qingshengii TaxID=1569794 RepID=A0ABR7TX86_9BACT|nr:alkaline phosphatase [Chitinophaga qingshengii]MBC9934257.1 alkaline phosphatase [Chitinophaga qingshengii]